MKKTLLITAILAFIFLGANWATVIEVEGNIPMSFLPSADSIVAFQNKIVSDVQGALTSAKTKIDIGVVSVGDSVICYRLKINITGVYSNDINTFSTTAYNYFNNLLPNDSPVKFKMYYDTVVELQ